MYIRTTILLIRKTVNSMMLLAVFLSAFGGGNFSFVHAKAEISKIPASTSQENHLNRVRGENSGNFDNVKAVMAQTTGTHKITYFHDNKAGAISVTFDDGYTSEATTGVSQLNARGLKGTFFVITDSDWVSDHVSWSTWRSVVAQGHEVASHTVNHQDLSTLSESEIRWELDESQMSISQNVPNQACASLAYPFTNSNSTVQDIAADYYVAARSGWVSPGRFLNHYQSGSDQYGSWNVINFYTIASMNGDSLGSNNAYLNDEYFNDSLDAAISRHAWFSLHFHEITSATEFGNILDYIQEKPGYWIDTFCDISRYMKERMNSTVQVVTDNTSEIRLRIVMNASLSTDTYNFPLTMRSTVPASWTEVEFQQGSTDDELTPVTEGSEKVVYYDAVPNGGDVVLTDSGNSTDPPSAFSKTSPANGASDQSLSPTLSWSASTGAASYEYCYDTSNDSACSTWTSNGTSTSKTLSGLNVSTTYYWHVRAVNAGGTTYADGSSAAYRSFTTVPNLPAAFNKTSPANEASDQPISLTLNWAAGTGAASYEYCYDTSNDNACSSWTSNGTSTSKALSNLARATTYYWHVRAINAGGTTYADGSSTAYRSFTTIPNLPVAFGKTSPANGATDQPISLTLSWAVSVGAVSYEYCYDTSNDNACSSWTSNGTSTSKILSDLARATTYYWHVRAVNVGGTTYADGSNTTYWSFTTVPDSPGAFNKISPANGAVDQLTSLTLSWADSAGVTSYEYCYDTSNDDDCSSWISNDTSTSVTLSSLARATTYYWHVRAVNVDGTIYADGSSTAYRSFTTIPNPPAAFDKTSPANGATDQSINPTLSWAASTGAASYEYCYDTSNDNDCSSWTSNGTSTSKVLSGLSRITTYYWHVRAVNVTGTTYADGSSTAYRSFTTVPNPPTAFGKTSPVNGATDQPISLTLSWAASTGATSYEYCYDTSNDNTCSSWTSNGTSTSKVLSGLARATTYYWHVRAVNAGGTTYADGSSTAYRSFTTIPNLPAAFAKASPANGAMNQPISPTLSWTASTGATSYEYCYDTSNDNACSSWTGNGTSTSKALSNLTRATTYYWHIRAINVGGTTYADGSSTAYRSFTTIPNPPAAFNKTSPANGAVNQPASLTLSWSASTGAASYEYCYDTSNDNACSSWTSNGTSTSKSLSGLSTGTTYYWHVRAVNGGGTTYANNNSSTAFWSFTRSCYTLTRNVTPSTGGAVNASPAANCNNGTQYTYGTTVTLTAVPSADASFFAWSGDASGDSNPVNVVMTANKTVTAVFATFTETLSAPTLRSPRSNLVTLNKMPTLLWTSVTGGQSYEIVSARDSDFTNIVEKKMVNGSSYTAASAFGDGRYYWRVRAYNASKQFGRWSTSRAFTIDTTGPSAPVPSFPANNGFVTRTPTFKWLIVPTAVIYEFQYDNNSNFSSPVNTLAVRANFRKPPAMPVGIYYWRVRAQDSAGNWGAWSVSFKVTLIGP